jgi:hypothetical protein
MSNRIVVIGGGGAGTGAGASAKQYNRSMSVTFITDFEDIANSPCGIPRFGRELKVDRCSCNQEFYRNGAGFRTTTRWTGLT